MICPSRPCRSLTARPPSSPRHGAGERMRRINKPHRAQQPNRQGFISWFVYRFVCSGTTHALSDRRLDARGVVAGGERAAVRGRALYSRCAKTRQGDGFADLVGLVRAYWRPSRGNGQTPADHLGAS